MLLQVLNILNYVVSQLTYCALPEQRILFEHDNSVLNKETSLEHLTLKDWEELVRYTEELFSDVSPYVTKFINGQREKRETLVKAVYDHLQACRMYGAEFITITDPRYPILLKTLSDPPLAITVLGSTVHLSRTMVAIVGSRKASCKAVRESFILGKELARLGYVVVSGGAFGCDIASHQGVLNDACERGSTDAKAVVVFAGGLSRLYPIGNCATFRKLREKNATFLSERLWSMTARPIDFPIRNRIISGLSECVFVMQAGENSGAGITAKLALDHGREVFVLKHEEDDVRAYGNRKLISEGAISFNSSSNFIDMIIKCAASPIG